MRPLFLAIAAFALVISLAVWQRHRIIIPLATSGAPIAPDWQASVPPDGQPFGEDGYFFVVQLDPDTFAIAEPYSWARNFNYLILGENRALMFDAGVGHYDIRSVIASLTDLPVTFMPSHFHYDHTGQGNWDRIAIVDLPHIRKQAREDRLTLSWGAHLGTAEGLKAPTWDIDEWVRPGSLIDLGGRQLKLLYTPGHTDNSVSLFDQDRQLMFTGDFLSMGGVSAFTPTAGMGDYLQTAERVLEATRTRPATVMHGAHGNESGSVPAQARTDVEALRDGLLRIKSGALTGEGIYPVVYMIREDMPFQAEPGWLQDWSPTYPEMENGSP